MFLLKSVRDELESKLVKRQLSLKILKDGSRNGFSDAWHNW
jgi:hypothetical protein